MGVYIKWREEEGKTYRNCIKPVRRNLKMSLYQMARGEREDLPELYQTCTTQFENESISNGERRKGRPTGTVSNIATSMNQQHYTTIHYTTTNLTSNTITFYM